MRKQNVLAASALVVMGYGCSANSDDGVIATVDSPILGVETFGTLYQAPPCNPLLQGVVVYIKSTNQLQYCDGSHYQPLSFTGTPGKDGVSWVVSVSSVATSCPYGGATVTAGPDANHDNVIDTVVWTQSICNGAPGAKGDPGPNGENALVRVVPFDASATCPNGGERILSGVDLNRDGILEDSEIQSTTEICKASSCPGTLTIEPKNAVVFTNRVASDGTPPATLPYKLTLTSDGTSTDVTELAQFAVIGSTLGTFSGSTFTSAASIPSAGATSSVWGTALGCVATTKVSVVPAVPDPTFVVPFGGPSAPSSSTVELGPARNFDLAILMDTTGSMGGELTRLRITISSVILPALSAAVPEAGFGFADLREYPVSPFSNAATDYPVHIGAPIEGPLDRNLFVDAIQSSNLGGGGDVPEAQLPAIHYLATNDGLTWPGGRVPARPLAVGTVGNMGFRQGFLPIIALVTDAPWHDASHIPYGAGFTAPSVESVAADLNVIGARFVNLSAGDETQGTQLATLTSSTLSPSAWGAINRPNNCAATQCCTGVNGAGRAPVAGVCPASLQILPDGSGLESALINATTMFAKSAYVDVTAVAAAAPGGAFDAPSMIKAIRAMDEGDGAACLPTTAIDTNGDGIKDTFPGGTAAGPVCFAIIPNTNSTVPQASSVQVARANIEIRADSGATLISTRALTFAVPPL